MNTIKTPVALFVWLTAQLAIAGARKAAPSCYSSVLSLVAADIAAQGYAYGMGEQSWDAFLHALKSPVGSLVTPAEERFAHFAMGRLASVGGQITTNEANIAMIHALGWSSLFAIEGEARQRHLVMTPGNTLGVHVRVRVAEGLSVF